MKRPSPKKKPARQASPKKASSKKASPKKRWLKWGIIATVVATLAFSGFYFSKRVNWNPSRTVGEALDSLHGIPVYYNGGVAQTHGRFTTEDGYNVGLRYQCVEFVKRYYLEHYRHKMPDAYGHAKDFFDPDLADGALNKARGLRQFKNGSRSRPQVGDLLVWGPTTWNSYGHVAIVSAVKDERDAGRHEVEYIQQNPGPFGKSRDKIRFKDDRSTYRLMDARLLGWLRMPK
ncbi:MAG TPA: CHAP domain-containing protein [Bacteroidia bacterium]|nr:CHAP domain-containing protein [Bacteroidia bacterium]